MQQRQATIYEEKLNASIFTSNANVPPPQGAGEGPAGSNQGDAVVATSSQGGQPTVLNHISLNCWPIFLKLPYVYFSDPTHGAQPYFSHF